MRCDCISDITACPTHAYEQHAQWVAQLRVWPNRSIIAHNTNIWAARHGSPSRALMTLKGEATITPPTAPPGNWTVTAPHGDELFGMGMRSCASLPPGIQASMAFILFVYERGYY